MRVGGFPRLCLRSCAAKRMTRRGSHVMPVCACMCCVRMHVYVSVSMCEMCVCYHSRLRLATPQIAAFQRVLAADRLRVCAPAPGSHESVVRVLFVCARLCV